MRVLFTTWAWPSHFYPLVQLAWAFQAAGHEVRVASQPSLAETITSAGLVAVPVGTDVDALEIMLPFYTWVAEQGRPIEWAELKPRGAETIRMYMLLARAMLDDTIAFTRHWQPDLIVHESTTYAGPLAAAVTGIPCVRHIYGVDFTYQAHEFEHEALARLRERLGLDSVDTLGLATVDPCPPSMQVPAEVNRLTMSYEPYNGVAVFPRWLREPPTRRRVCVTWGTSTTRLTESKMFLPPRILAACTDLDVEFVVSLAGHDAAAIAEQFPQVRVVSALALHLLLPSCAVLVHQGGNGTIMTAARFGVPQLVLPQLPDQMFYTDKLVETGAGIALRVDEVSDEALRSTLEKLLSDEGYASSAARVRAEMLAQPSAQDTVRALVELVARHRG